MNKLKGANFDITPLNCPLTMYGSNKKHRLIKSSGWTAPSDQKEYKCALKDVSICNSFFELKDKNTVICCYPKHNHIIRFILLKLGFKKYIIKHSQEIEVAGCNADLVPKENLKWKQDKCPWNVDENTIVHKCVCDDKSACKHFCGIEYIDKLLCSYPNTK